LFLLPPSTTLFPYTTLFRSMDIINRAYIEVMQEGDAMGQVFTFPIPTYNITRDFSWDSDNANLLFAMTARYGLPYFQNFINSDIDRKSTRLNSSHVSTSYAV